MPKIYVLDTNLPIDDPDSINNFDEHDVHLHGAVFEEIDHLKRKPDKAYDAREAARRINEYVEKGWLADGIPTPGGGKFFIDFTLDSEFDLLPVGLEKKNDNRMILLAKKLQIANPDRKVIFVSNDIAPRGRANACGILSEPYKHNLIDKIYTGTKVIDLVEGSEDIISKCFKEKWLAASDVFSRSGKIKSEDLFPNQCCYLNTGGKTALAIYKKKAGYFQLVQNIYSGNVVPRNSEQLFAYHMLMDPEIDLVTLMGQAGTGKTLLAISAGYAQVNSRYDQLLVFRPTNELGEDLGFRPGTLEEKFAPWMKPVYDAFYIMLGFNKKNGSAASGAASGKKKGVSKKVDQLQLRAVFEKPNGVYAAVQSLIDNGYLMISPINFIQGQNFFNEVIVVEEPQNFSRRDIKMIASRPAEGSKVVFVGDPTQIANDHIDSRSNGFVHLIDTYKNKERVGHLLLREKVYRGYLAEISAEL